MRESNGGKDALAKSRTRRGGHKGPRCKQPYGSAFSAAVEPRCRAAHKPAPGRGRSGVGYPDWGTIESTQPSNVLRMSLRRFPIPNARPSQYSSP
jgi:hypothetical protein